MFVLSPALDDILHTPVAQYSLFVLKMPLKTNQPYVTVALRHCGVHSVKLTASSSF